MKHKIRILIFSLLLTPFIGIAQIMRSANVGSTILSSSEINTAVFSQKEILIASSSTAKSFMGAIGNMAEIQRDDLSLLSVFEITLTGTSAFSISIPSKIDITYPGFMDDPIKRTISIDNTLPVYMEGTTFIVKVDARYSFAGKTKKCSYTTNPFEIILHQE